MSFNKKDITELIDSNRYLLEKDAWLVILHASRIPPHIGILINGKYHSLTIKGHELNIDIKALEKTISIKNIESLFLKLKPHPVFSLDYQTDVMIHFIQQFEKVNSQQSTCLTPIKFFLQEFYALQYQEKELLFDMIERLKSNDFIVEVLSDNIHLNSETTFKLPRYSNFELQERISYEHSLIKKK